MKTGNVENEVTQPIRFDCTLPGLGPRVGVEQLEARWKVEEPVELDAKREAVLAYLERENARYEWFVDRLEPTRSVRELAATLMAQPSQPGAWEAALVGLSVSEEPMAQVVLEQWEAPSGGAKLSVFRQICVVRGRRGAQG